ncbi:MAG: DcrB-related protein [Telluria sp.]
MNYQINEGSFALTSQAQDRSVHMLVLNFGPGGLTLVVTRDLAEEGELLDAMLRRQLRTLGSQVKQLKHSEPLALQVGPARLPAFQVSTSFKQNNASVHQLQTMVALRDKAVLAFTLTCASPLTAEQAAYAQQVLDSFTPSTPT